MSYKPILNFLFPNEKWSEVWYANFMRKKNKPIFNFILSVSLAAALAGAEGLGTLTVEATSVSDIQNKIAEDQAKINALYNQIVGLESAQDLLQEEIDDLNAEIVNTMTSISMKEDEIAEKEREISGKEGEIAGKEEEIAQKKIQIEETEAEYEAAVVREDTLRENIAACTRLIYETGEESILNALLEGKGFSGVLNRMDRIEKMYEYERNLLLEYIDMKNQVHDLWDQLEEEKAGLEADKQQLEEDKQDLVTHRQQLQTDKAELQGQKSRLDTMLAKKKQESANYEAELARARQDAAVAKKALEQDQQRLKQLQATATKPVTPTYTPTDYSTAIDNANGSDLGKQIANFACQYIGNPYVYGGTSLTNGADCSGFTYRVYSNYGYTLPRTSTQQQSVGTGVSYSEAQPGDIICYDGHVAIYIGNGMIVHASNSNPYPSGGIKVSRAEYKTILTVRRIIN